LIPESYLYLKKAWQRLFFKCIVEKLLYGTIGARSHLGCKDNQDKNHHVGWEGSHHEDIHGFLAFMSSLGKIHLTLEDIVDIVGKRNM
jgi:hypothetical protein